MNDSCPLHISCTDDSTYTIPAAFLAIASDPSNATLLLNQQVTINHFLVASLVIPATEEQFCMAVATWESSFVACSLSMKLT